MARRMGSGFVLGVLLATATAGLALLAPAACTAAGGSIAPADPAFLRYLERGATAERLGLAPAPVSSAGVPRAHLAPLVARLPGRYATAGAPSALAASDSAQDTPISFDLRDAGKLSLIRDQGRYGTCWAFASLASLESSLLPAAASDFSENNLAHRAGFALGYDDGGNSYMAAAYLLRWDGPADEADDTYAPYASTPNPASDAAVRAHVQEVLYLPSRTSSTDNRDLKWAVMSYGAVYTTMYWTSSAYRGATASYYCSGSGANHAVDIVGWDDGYPATAFASPPAGPGAFLARNSWGTDFGAGGYFWVSYYDTVFGRGSAVFDRAEAADDAERIYQHDPLGWVSSYRPPDAADPTTAWFAASYAPAEDGSLTAAGFYATGPGATYEIRVAESVEGLGGVAVAAAGTLDAAGFHTVALDEPVALTAGRSLVIAVRLSTPGYRFPVAIERPYSGYADATAAAGQSYVSGDGSSWTDMTTLVAGTDVCLKGYGRVTATPGPDPSPDPSPSPSASPDPAPDPAPEEPAAPVLTLRGGSTRAGCAVRLAFRVSHPDVTATADVRFTLRDRRGTVLRRRTLRDVDLTARHAWRLRAPARRGAYVIVAVATLDTGQVSRVATATLRVR